MIILDVVDLAVIAGRTHGTGTEAALDQLDVAAARAALAEADCGGAEIADQGGAANAAIALIHALLHHRPFPRQGDQIAVAAGLQFLSLNGWRAELDPPATAAVVVEALASGQLSQEAAAAWLAPRLTADKRLANRKPASVSYPQVLLYIQAGCWAAVSALGLLWMPIALSNNDIPLWQEAELLGLLALAGGLAAAKVVLARRVHRIRSARTRRAVIITELAMTCFGLLWLLIPAYGFIAAGFSGACLSLAAVLCMTRPRARLYFNHPDPLPVNPHPGALSGPASFRRLALTSPGLAVM